MIRHVPLSKPNIGEEEKSAVLEVMNSGMLAQGPKVAAFEEAFAACIGTRYAVACSSGTAALSLALLAHGIGPGDEVITSPFTFIASVNSILHVGATPVFCDIEEDSFLIDLKKLPSLITPRTKGILPIHLYGLANEMEELMHLSARYNVSVIEDCAQAIGAKHRGQSVGSFGTGCFSLYATKNVMCGEGGMITTNDPQMADQMRMLRNHGMRARYVYEGLGYNFRMNELHAAIGFAQLSKLEDFTFKRRENAKRLTEGLKGVQGLVLPSLPEDATRHVWHQYTVRARDASGVSPKFRSEVVKRLREVGIETGIFYPRPAHQELHIKKNLKANSLSLPVSEKASEEVFSLPVHPSLSKEDIEYMVHHVHLCMSQMTLRNQ